MGKTLRDRTDRDRIDRKIDRKRDHARTHCADCSAPLRCCTCLED